MPVAPAIALAKSASPSDAASFRAGQPITYTFVATNTGNVTLTSPTVTEGTFTGSGTLSPVSCPPTASLDPGGQLTCTATYTITQTDVAQRAIVNNATASGITPGGLGVVSPVAVALVQVAALPNTGVPISSQLWMLTAFVALGIIAIAYGGRRSAGPTKRRRVS
jgi:hypothetical protein